MSTPRVYVSGGIKGVPDFVERFAEASAKVALWAIPINPVEIQPCRAAGTNMSDNPCIYPGEMVDGGHTWQCYMRHDIEVLVHCDGIYMMRGWSKSKGASEELRIAQMLGLDIHFQSDGTEATK